MDAFASLLKETASKASKKRKIMESNGGKKKYRRRGELEEAEEEAARQLREKERIKEEHEKEKERKVRELKKINRERKRQGLPPLKKLEEEEVEEEKEEEIDIKDLLPAWEVKRRLRIIGHPITLFGETDLDRWKRLKKEELIAHERMAGSMGDKDIFRDIMSKEVEEDLKEIEAEDEGMEKEKALRKERQMAKYTKHRPRESFSSDHKYVLHFFKRMLFEWQDELERRDAEEKRTIKGKMDSATQKQTRQFIKPMFKLLKSNGVSQDVFKHVLTIVVNCEKRNYKLANEAYMMLAIGNAAWPMGVTMVGIHERAGRSKIFSQNVAHVLNDETQRKYIQSIKRLMSFCKQKYPPTNVDQLV
ncbi:hypothetical protein AAMO2058_000165900 [Amorphochlora amoebiformis]